jgi:hypothetical protein
MEKVIKYYKAECDTCNELWEGCFLPETFEKYTDKNNNIKCPSCGYGFIKMKEFNVSTK